MAAACMMQDTSFWLNRRQVEEAECSYYAKLSGASPQSAAFSAGQTASGDNPVLARLVQVEEENRELRKVTNDLQAVVKSLEARIKALEIGSGKATAAAPAAAKPAAKKPAPPSSDSDDSDDDDDVDLFGSDDDETKAAAEKIKQERLAAYAAKKAKKPQVIAKSNVILDIKPWDDETDMAEMEQKVRTIEMDGLLWGASKLVPVGYGIKKLQIATVIEDDKVSTEVLEEMICEFEDHVQSVDIAAFNKI